MATIQAVNVLTGSAELGKYNATGDTSEIWKAATTTSLALNDVISGPIIPAGTYLRGVSISWTDVDSATTFSWTAGYSGTAAAFISTSTVGQSAGIATMNVATALGFTATTDTTVLITITASATAVAGTCVIAVSYTASP